jgi:hypothetical protein
LLEYPLILPLRHHLTQDAYYTVVELILILRNALLILATLGVIWQRSLLGIRLGMRPGIGRETVGSHPESHPESLPETLPADATLAPE